MNNLTDLESTLVIETLERKSKRWKERADKNFKEAKYYNGRDTQKWAYYFSEYELYRGKEHTVNRAIKKLKLN